MGRAKRLSKAFKAAKKKDPGSTVREAEFAHLHRSKKKGKRGKGQK